MLRVLLAHALCARAPLGLLSQRDLLFGPIARALESEFSLLPAREVLRRQAGKAIVSSTMWRLHARITL